MTNKERIEDLLIEFDELDMQPMLIVPDPLDRAKVWKHELIYAIKHLEAEVAREIFEEIDKIRMIERAAYKRGVEGCYNSDLRGTDRILLPS